MSAKWKLNLLMGFIGFFVTFLFSLWNNTWQTSVLRSGMGFLLFFSLGILMNLALQGLGNEKYNSLAQVQKNEKEIKVEQVPKIQKEEKPMGDPSFKAVSLTSLHQTTDLQDPETIANTIRTWKNQRQEG